jgi:hypothetical protein
MTTNIVDIAFGFLLALVVLIAIVTLQLRLSAMWHKHVFYGPYRCQICQTLICKDSARDGGHEYNYPDVPIYPNTLWNRHRCPILMRQSSTLRGFRDSVR